MPMFEVYTKKFPMPSFSNLLMTELLQEDYLQHGRHIIAVPIKICSQQKMFIFEGLVSHVKQGP
jgi:hypothetical protein